MEFDRLRWCIVYKDEFHPVFPRYAIGSLIITVLAIAISACRIPGKSIDSNYKNVSQFNFDVAVGAQQYHIEGYLTHTGEQGRRPAMLVLNGEPGSVDRCVAMSQSVAAMGIQVACVNIPGYGGSSGPDRLVGRPRGLAWRRGRRFFAGQNGR